MGCRRVCWRCGGTWGWRMWGRMRVQKSEMGSSPARVLGGHASDPSGGSKSPTRPSLSTGGHYIFFPIDTSTLHEKQMPMRHRDNHVSGGACPHDKWTNGHMVLNMLNGSPTTAPAPLMPRATDKRAMEELRRMKFLVSLFHLRSRLHSMSPQESK